MISKCANPGCSTQFLYLRTGKLFVFDKHSKPPEGHWGPAHGRKHEFFWLCGECVRRLTMEYDPSRRLPVVVPNDGLANPSTGAAQTLAAA